MDEPPVSLEHVQRLLVVTVGTVLALDVEVELDARFDEDLHADSLDLLEVVENVERALAAEGVEVSLPDAALAGLRTVGEAAQRIHASAAPAR